MTASMLLLGRASRKGRGARRGGTMRSGSRTGRLALTVAAVLVLKERKPEA